MIFITEGEYLVDATLTEVGAVVTNEVTLRSGIGDLTVKADSPYMLSQATVTSSEEMYNLEEEAGESLRGADLNLTLAINDRYDWSVLKLGSIVHVSIAKFFLDTNFVILSWSVRTEHEIELTLKKTSKVEQYRMISLR